MHSQLSRSLPVSTHSNAWLEPPGIPQAIHLGPIALQVPLPSYRLADLFDTLLGQADAGPQTPVGVRISELYKEDHDRIL